MNKYRDDFDIPFVMICRRRKNNNFISNSCSFLFLSAINHNNDQVDENESDMLMKQMNFVDNQLIIIVIALPCGVVLIIMFIVVVVVVVVLVIRHLADVV